MKCSKNLKAATRFTEFLASPPALRIFERYGYRALPEKIKSSNHLLVYAGAGLRRGIDAAAAAFEKDYGVEVEVDYGGSGMALNRAKENKDGDVFIPGDVWYVDLLQKKSGIVASRKKIAAFIPVIIVAKGNPLKIDSLKDLFSKRVKSAFGNPETCQIGRLSKKMFVKNGLDIARISPKYTLTVNEMGVLMKLRDIDAAIVWKAIAANIADDVDIVEIPKSQNIISEVDAALLTTTSDKKWAVKFIDYIANGKGRAILISKGYAVDE